jgi:hypothetical protein
METRCIHYNARLKDLFQKAGYDKLFGEYADEMPCGFIYQQAHVDKISAALWRETLFQANNLGPSTNYSVSGFVAKKLWDAQKLYPCPDQTEDRKCFKTMACLEALGAVVSAKLPGMAVIQAEALAAQNDQTKTNVIRGLRRNNQAAVFEHLFEAISHYVASGKEETNGTISKCAQLITSNCLSPKAASLFVRATFLTYDRDSFDGEDCEWEAFRSKDPSWTYFVDNDPKCKLTCPYCRAKTSKSEIEVQVEWRDDGATVHRVRISALVKHTLAHLTGTNKSLNAIALYNRFFLAIESLNRTLLCL